MSDFSASVALGLDDEFSTGADTALKVFENLGRMVTAAMGTAAQSTAAFITQVQGMTGAVTAAGQSSQAAGTGVSSIGTAAAQAAPQVTQLGTAMGGLSSNLASLAATLGLSFGFGALIKEGLHFNELMETNKLSLTALILTFKDLTDVQGHAVEESKRFAAASDIAADIQSKLRMAAFGTSTTLEVLSTGFNKLFAASAGQKATTDDLIKLTQTVANFGTLSGKSLELVYSQISLLLLGVTRSQGAIGAFARSLGISPAVAKEWAAAGDSVQNLNAKLIQYINLAGTIQGTFAGLKSQVVDVFQQLTGAGGEQLFQKMKVSMAEFVGQFIQFSDTELPRFKDGVLDTARAAGIGIAGMWEVMGDTAKNVLMILDSVFLDRTTTWLDYAKIFGVAFVKVFALAVEGITILINTLAHPIDAAKALIDQLRASEMRAHADILDSPLGGLGPIDSAAAKRMREEATALEVASAASNKWISNLETIDQRTKDAINSAAGYANGLGGLSSATQKSGDELAKMAAKAKEAAKSLIAEALDPLSQKGLAIDAQIAGLSGTTAGKLEQIRLHALEATNSLKKLAEQMKAKPENAGLFDLIDQKLGEDVAKEQQLAAAQSAKVREDAADKQLKAAEGFWKDLSAIDTKGATSNWEKVAEEYDKGIADLISKEHEALRKLKELGKDNANQTGLPELLAADEAKAVARLGVVREQGYAKIHVAAMDAETKFWADMATLSETGANTQQEKIDAAYSKGMEKVRKTAQDGMKELLSDFADGGVGISVFTVMLGQLEAAKKAAAEREAETQRLSTTLLHAELTKDWKTYYETLVVMAQKNGQNVAEATLGAAKKTADEMAKSAVTAADGMAAAWAQLSVQIGNSAKIAGQYITDVWNTTKQGFDSILVDGVTKGWSGVLGALKQMSDGYLKDFSKMVTSMVEKWILGQREMRAASVTNPGGAGGGQLSGGVPATYPDGTSTGGGSGGAVAGYAGAGLGAAAAAFGGATGGAQSFGQGLAPYLSVAAMIAANSQGNIYALAAAAVVAIIGVIVNLLSPNTEQIYRLTAQNLKLTGMGDLAGGAPGSGGLIAKSMGGQALVDYQNKLSGSLYDSFLSAAPEQAAALAKAVNEAISKYLLSINFEVHAGSDEDIKKDFTNLFTQVMPHEIWAKLFGLQPNLGGSQGVPGGLDLPGISGATNFGVKGMDMTSPLVSFLTSMGFTIAKVKELAAESQQTDPQVFLDRFKGLVEIVVRINSLQKELAKSSSDVWSDVLTARAASPAATFQDQAAKLVSMSQQIASYTGDTQIAKQKELLTLYEQYVAAQKAAITQLLDLAQKFTDTVNATLARNQDVLKGPDQLRADAYRRVNAVFTGQDFNAGTLAHTTTAAQIDQISQQALADLQSIFNGLVGMLHQAESLQTGFADLTRQLSMSNAQIWDAAHKNPLRVIAENIADLQEKLNDAGGLQQGSQAWLDVMGQIRDEGVATFQAIGAEIDKIHAGQVSLDQTFDAQIQGIRRSLMGNQAQLDTWNKEIFSLTDKLQKDGHLDQQDQARLTQLQGLTKNYDPKELIRDYVKTITEDRAALATAQSPEEIQRLTAEISSTIGLYMQQFAADDPQRQAAADWSVSFLKDVQKEAHAAYGKLDAELTAAKNQLYDQLKGIPAILTDVTNGLKDELWHVQKAFERLRDEVNAAYVSLASHITDPNSGLVAAMEGTRTAFVDTTTPVTEFGAEVGGAAGDVRDLRGEVVGLKGDLQGLRREIGNGGSSSVAAPTVQSAATGDRWASARVVKTNPSALRLRTAFA